MVKFAFKNLLNSDATYICHQVNCQGAMNSGVAKAIRNKWPVVYQEYLNKFNGHIMYNLPKSTLLGDIQVVDVENNKYVLNMFSQENFGYDKRRYTSYDSFWTCLELIKLTAPIGSKIAFPYKIGCDRGGANWNVIYVMICEALGKDYDVEICYLEEDDWIYLYNTQNFCKTEEN